MNILTAGVETVAPDGDIIFLVGASKKGVRVDSAVLKKASPIFATNLSESPGLRARCGKSFFIIELPDDDAEAFITITKLIHRVPGSIFIMPTLDAVCGCVDLANKYKFNLRLSAIFVIWIKDLARCKDTLSLWKLLVCAYKLDHDQAFTQASRQLLLIQGESFWRLAQSTPTFELSFKLAYALEYVKSTVMILFARILDFDAVQYLCDYPKCDQNRESLIEFTRMFQKTLLEETGVVWCTDPVEEVIRVFKNCRETEKRSDSVTGGLVEEQGCSCDEHMTVEDFCSLARSKGDYYESRLLGISLQDFKEGKFQEFDF